MPTKLHLPDKQCLKCGNNFGRDSVKSVATFKEKKFCSHKCAVEYNSGENHWYWKGGTKKRPDGYIRDSKTDQYIHRIVMEKHLGRKLLTHEQVHHINEDPSDNRLENLILTKNGEHRKKYHSKSNRDNKGRYAKD